MRILHILDHGLPAQSGYTFRTRAILKAQQTRGHVVAGVTGPRHGRVAAVRETVDGLDFFRTAPRAGGLPLIGEWREINQFAARIEEAIAEFRPDVLHAHSPVLNALAALKVARRHGLPLVYEIRAFWEDAAVGNNTGREGSLKYRAIRAAETWAASRADTVAVICEGLRDDLVTRGIDRDRIIVSPNGVDLTLFGAAAPYEPELAAQLGLDDAEVLGFIGSFYDYEGLDDLIAAMPAIVAARPHTRLLLVGGGPREADWRALAAASAAAGHIRFVGRVPHDEVERYYSLIDVLVYPRKRMRLTELVTPLKPLEAMAQSRLVAASDVGGHRELIRDGETGTLFPADDPIGLAAAVTGLLADRDHWDERRRRGRGFVETKRDWAVNAARYDPVYQMLTAGVTQVGAMEDTAIAIPPAEAVRTRPPLASAIRLPDWPIAPTLAAIGGMAIALVFLLMPAALLEGMVSVSGLPGLLAAAEPPLGFTARTALALLFGGGFAAVAWFALSLLAGARTVTGKAEDLIRRGDIHPDAPPRAPLIASADLGRPFLDVRALPTATPALPIAEAAPVLELTATVPEPRHLSIEDFEPAAEPPTTAAEPVPVLADPVAVAPILEPRPLPSDLGQTLTDYYTPVIPDAVREPVVADMAPVPLARPQLIDPGDRFETFELTPMTRLATGSIRADVPGTEVPVSPASGSAPLDLPVVTAHTEETIQHLLARLEKGVVARDQGQRPGSIEEALGDLRRLARGG